MRMTQVMGLPREARVYVETMTKTVPIDCPHCGHQIDTRRKTKVYASARQLGMFNDGPDLNEYELDNGKTVKEVVQASPWSSGPCIFLKLVDDEGKDMFVWDEKDIENA